MEAESHRKLEIYQLRRFDKHLESEFSLVTDQWMWEDMGAQFTVCSFTRLFFFFFFIYLKKNIYIYPPPLLGRLSSASGKYSFRPSGVCRFSAGSRQPSACCCYMPFYGHLSRFFQFSYLTIASCNNNLYFPFPRWLLLPAAIDNLIHLTAAFQWRWFNWCQGKKKQVIVPLG